MTTATIPELGSFPIAGREAVRTPRMERTTGRNPDQRRRRALDRNQVRDLLVGVWDRLEEAPRVGVQGLAEDLLRDRDVAPVVLGRNPEA